MPEQLHGVSRFLRAGGHRRTRFHTERGDLLPVTAVPELFRSVRNRFRRRQGSFTPWMVDSAVRDLDRRVGAHPRVLEVGSGYSTLWWAHRAREVTSLEASSAWAADLREQLRAEALANVSLVEVSIANTLQALADFLDGSFDVVVVDCAEAPGVSRLDVVKASERLVAAGGFLVLDDSDRNHLWPADSQLIGWTRSRHVGVKPSPLMAVETTLYQRPTS
jgi:hypothetical protein